MSRIRVTSRGLEMVQEQGVLSFSPLEAKGLYVSLKESVLYDWPHDRLYVIEGRDNIADFGQWFSQCHDPIGGVEEATSSELHEDTADPRAFMVCISTSWRDFTLEEDPLRRSLVVFRQILGDDYRDNPRALAEFVSRLSLPAGHTPVLLAVLHYKRLEIQFSEVAMRYELSYESMREFGRWLLTNMNVVKSRSPFA
jgi:hypothetical protein